MISTANSIAGLPSCRAFGMRARSVFSVAYQGMGSGVVRPGTWCVLVLSAGIATSNPFMCRADDRVCFSKPILVDGELPSVTIPGAFDLSTDFRDTLSRPVRSAWLTEVERLTDDEMAVVARVPGFVCLRSSEDLSLQAAEYLGRHRGILIIQSLRALSDDAAAKLSHHRGNLHLDDVAQLTDKAMAALARSADKLTLGVERLTPHQARILSQVRDGLDFPRLSVIDEETAEILGRYRGTLQIGLTEMSPEVARSLARRESSLEFNTIEADRRLRLNAAVARALANYRGDLVIRPEFEGEAEDVLSALAQHSGTLKLFLEQPLTVEMARALSDHAGPLCPDSLLPITPEVATMLARHRSFLDMMSCNCDAPGVVEALSRHRGIGLQLYLGQPLDETSARALAAYQGRLHLHEVAMGCCRRTSAAAVRAIASHRGRLLVPESMVRDDTIDALRTHVGGLHVNFSMLDAPRVEIVRALADVEGWLRVDAEMSSEGLDAVATHRGDLVLRELPQAEKDVETLLTRKEGKLYFPYRDATVKTVAAARLVASDVVASNVNHTSAILGPDAVAIATALAERRGPFSLPYLKYLTADALRALVRKDDIELAPLDELYVFDNEWCLVAAEDVVPESFEEFNARHQPPRSLSWRQQVYEQ